MEYRCRTHPLDKLAVGPMGVMTSLCESCKTSDCSNPIEKQKVSVFGVTREIRLFVRGSEYYCVIECSGFTT